MATRPQPTSIFHITHVDNLASIVEDGGLLSDAEMVKRGGPDVAVGMNSIKQRRLNLPVKCHPEDKVGEYVPFYFCARSVMLYLLYMGNHPELDYHEGQSPIIHLQCDVDVVIAQATATDCRWAFTFANAGAVYTPFASDADQLDNLGWDAIAAKDFRDARIKEAKQSEFLVKDFVPWGTVERVGVYSDEVAEEVREALEGAAHRPSIEVRRDWYF